mgnify:FL=1
MPGHQPQRPSDIFGLIIIMCGLMFYRFGGQLYDRYFASKKQQLKRAQSREDMMSERKATARSAAYVGLAGPSAGIDRPLNEPLLQDRIRREKR